MPAMSYRSAIIALFLANLSLAAHSYGGPRGFQVITYGGSSHFQATQTILFQQGSGRLLTREVKSLQRSRTCDHFLGSFQAFPLREMLESKYITRETYERAMEVLPEQLDARQLLLITAFEDLPASQVSALNIPKDRVFTDALALEPGLIRVAIGTIYVVRGQILSKSARTGKAPPLTPLSVAWELNINTEKNASVLNREKIPMLLEFGRLTMKPLRPEDSPLDQSMHLAFSILETEAALLGISPEQVVVTSQFFDRGHTRLFLRGWPLKPLTPELKTRLENDPVATMAQPRESTEPDANGVVFGSLSQHLAAFREKEISETAERMAIASKGALSGQRAKLFLNRMMSRLRRDYDFVVPDGTVSPRGPIQIRDRGTALVDIELAEFLRQELGVELVNPKVAPPSLQPLVKLIEGVYWNPEPEWLSNGWVDPTYFVAKDSAERKHAVPALEVANIDPILAGQFPVTYEASLILAIAHDVQARGQNLAPFFDQTPLRIASSDSGVSARLQLLGGRPIEAIAPHMSFIESPSGVKVEMGIIPAFFFEFRSAQIQAIGEQFPQLNINARERLRPGTHATRLMLLNSAYQ